MVMVPKVKKKAGSRVLPPVPRHHGVQHHLIQNSKVLFYRTIWTMFRIQVGSGFNQIIGFGSGIRIWNPHPDPGGQKGPTKIDKSSVADPGCKSRIPDPNFFHPESRIRVKEFKFINPKDWFLRSRKYDPGCSSRIRIQGSKRHRIPVRNTGRKLRNFMFWSARCSLLRGEGFSCSFNVLYGGPVISKL